MKTKKEYPECHCSELPIQWLLNAIRVENVPTYTYCFTDSNGKDMELKGTLDELDQLILGK